MCLVIQELVKQADKNVLLKLGAVLILILLSEGVNNQVENTLLTDSMPSSLSDLVALTHFTDAHLTLR